MATLFKKLQLPLDPHRSQICFFRILYGAPKELEIAGGMGFLIRPDAMLQPGPMSLFVNPDTGTWTMVIKYAPPGFPKIWCTIGAGTAFGPVIEKTSI